MKKTQYFLIMNIKITYKQELFLVTNFYQQNLYAFAWHKRRFQCVHLYHLEQYKSNYYNGISKLCPKMVHSIDLAPTLYTTSKCSNNVFIGVSWKHFLDLKGYVNLLKNINRLYLKYF